MLTEKEAPLEDDSFPTPCSPRAGPKSRCSSESSLCSQQEYASTAPPSCSDTSSETSDSDNRSDIEAIPWSIIKYGERIRPVSGHAHCADDIYLLSAYLELMHLPDIDSDAVKLALKALALLRLCKYSVEDLCSILAHASAYLEDAHACCRHHMDASEFANVLVLVMFVATSYVQDETCPLHVWHQYLFQKYCSLKALNAAIISILEIRSFVLRVESQDLSHRYATLYRSIHRDKMEHRAGYEVSACIACRRGHEYEHFSCIPFRRVVLWICSALQNAQP